METRIAKNKQKNRKTKRKYGGNFFTNIFNYVFFKGMVSVGMFFLFRNFEKAFP